MKREPDTLFMAETEEAGRTGRLIRPRLNALLAGAVKQPLSVVCAGTGCGKTRAALDFARSRKTPPVWIQAAESDNAGPRFCENVGRALHRGAGPCLLIIDDAHLLQAPPVLQFLEKTIAGLPPGAAVLLLCRELPPLHAASCPGGLVPALTESELNFTESELAELLEARGLAVSRGELRAVFEDTRGWAFAAGLAARSLQNSPGYAGYVKNAMRDNIFGMMDAGAWQSLSGPARRLLARLSLTGHFSAELVSEMAGGDEAPLRELRKLNMYMRLDGHTGAYAVHPAYLDFLRSRQGVLSPEEERGAFQTAAGWCGRNGFDADALDYCEKAGDYRAAALLLQKSVPYMPRELALRASGFFERVPPWAFEQTEFLAALHLRVLLCLYRREDFLRLAGEYERRFLAMEESALRNRTLAGIYCFRGHMRYLQSTEDGLFDFDEYFLKAAAILSGAPEPPPGEPCAAPVGAWANPAGDSGQGVLQKAIAPMERAAGAGGLLEGELLFYQGCVQQAEPVFFHALSSALKNRRYEAAQKILFYQTRLAVLRGSRVKAERCLKEMEALTGGGETPLRFILCDAALGWYALALRRPETVPRWLRDGFSPYSHANSAENLTNQIRARLCYQLRDFTPLLLYIGEMKERESVLYGRAELLAMEGCAHFQLKDRDKAFAALREAYQAAAPNGLLTPFIELGKDMRTLAAAALAHPACGLPATWLESVKRRASSYAKNQSLVIADYKRANKLGGEKDLSAREEEVLRDLYRGLSRPEIAESQSLSIGTVNTVVSSIYAKLNAQGKADIIRIAAERKLV